MSFFNRVNVALEELNEGALESEVETGSVEDQELDMVDTADEAGLAEAEAEIATDNESIDEAVEVSDELQEQAESNEEALENPEEVTEEQVEVAEECLKMNLARLGMVDMYKEANSQFKLAHESYSSPAERLQIAQEGIKETIGKIIEWIRNLFRKIILWFKKMYAKLIVMFNRNLARAKKVKELVLKRNDGVVDADEFAAIGVDNPLVAYLLVKDANRLEIDKNAQIVDAIKVAVDGVNKAVSENNLNAINSSAIDKFTFAKNDVSYLKTLGGEVDTTGGKYAGIITNPTGKKPKLLLLTGKASEDKQSVDIEVKYEGVELDQETAHNKVKDEAGDKIKKDFIKSNLDNIIKSANKIKKFADTTFKTINSGGALANAFANLQKKAEKAEQGEMNSNAYTKAANIGRKLAGQAAVDVVIGAIRGQGVAVSILAACAKQLDNKKK